MPLATARDLLRRATEVTRENLDEVWASMLSLADGHELLEAARHLVWRHPPRGRENVDLVERYGAGVLPWLASRREGGVLVNHPWCVVPCLLAVDAPEALELLLQVEGVDADGGKMTAWVFERDGAHPDAGAFAADATRLVLDWTRLHPDAAYPALARLAPSNPRAAQALRELATASPADVRARLAALGAAQLADDLGLPERLSTDDVLAQLDALCEQSWPIFVTGVDGRVEYFGLRVIGVRARQGDGWAIVFERLQGCGPDAFAVSRFAYGPRTVNGWSYDNMHSLYDAFSLRVDDGAEAFHGAVARGPAGPLTLDESLFARHDLMPGVDVEFGGWPAFTLAVRAYLAEHPGVFWPPAEDALTAAGLPDGEIVVVSTSYQHPSRSALEPADAPWAVAPSRSMAMRSLVEAVLAGDPARFDPGPPNTDWRLHAREPNHRPPPWSVHREDTSKGFLPAAMREAGVDPDERGLMPLAQARAVVAGLERLERGHGRRVGERWVWGHDLAWAALLSLGDAAEAGRALARCTIVDGPRDAARNTALNERFGDDALVVVGARAGEGGIIDAASPFLRATVLATASTAGFAFVWDTGGWREPRNESSAEEQATALFTAWATAHPEIGYVELGRRALAGDQAAMHFLTTWAAPQPRRVFKMLLDGLGDEQARALYGQAGLSVNLVPAHVLACLDLWAAQAGQDPAKWPIFRVGRGPSVEYHALRLVAARRRGGDDWVVVLERYQGYNQHLCVQRHVYGEGVACGQRDDLRVSLAHLNERMRSLKASPEDTALIEPPDYWTKIDAAPEAVARARALLTTAPDEVWPDVGQLLEKLGFAPDDARIVSTSFTHTDGPNLGGPLPSASPTYQSLADALASGDPARFVGGPSNLAARAR